MPRAVPPKRAAGSKRVGLFCLGTNDQNLLLRMLGANKSPNAKEIVTHIEWLLSSYFARKDNADGVSPKRLLAAIRPAYIYAGKLKQQLENLDEHSSMLLIVQGWNTKENQKIQELAVALERAVKQLEDAITEHKERINKHLSNEDGGVNWPLRLAVSELFMAFHNFKSPASKSDWKDFVSAALSAANIKHPQPDTHPHRLTKLLPKLARDALKQRFIQKRPQ